MPPPPPPPPPPYGARSWPYGPMASRAPRVHVEGAAERLFRATLITLDPFSAAGVPTIAAVGLIAVLTDSILHVGVGGAGFAVLVASLAAGVAAFGGYRQPDRLAMVGLAMVLSGLGVWRASPWVAVPADGLALICLLSGALVGPGRRLFDQSWTEMAGGGVASVCHALLAPPWLIIGVLSRLPAVRGLPGWAVRGAVVGVPLVLILTLLLMSADPVFASLLDVRIDGTAIAGHVALLAGGAWLAAALISTSHVGTRTTPRRSEVVTSGGAEALVVLALIAALFSVFVAAQVAAALGVGRAVLAQQGVSYSECARSGYFQLLWVVGIAGIVLVGLEPLVRRCDGPVRRRAQVLSILVVALTLAIVGVAARRLWLYDDAYGLTLLRLSSAVGAVWMAIVLVMLAAWVGGPRWRRRWLPGALLVSAVVAMCVVAIANPERYVAGYDVGHASTGRLDVAYLGSLSDDAVPSLSASLSSLPGPEAAELRTHLCARPPSGSTWTQWSIGAADANHSLGEMCPGRR